MSKEKRIIIDKFCRRFLDVEKKPESFSNILDLSPKKLKDCNDEEVKKLKNVKIKTIRDLYRTSPEEIARLAKEAEVDPIKLRKWVIAGNLVRRAWKKRSSYLKKQDSKIAVLGLDNAGKTTLLRKLSGLTNLTELADLDPTTGVDVSRINVKNYEFILWDFGGQVNLRTKYIEKPEDYFLHLDLILYVIDIQDPTRFEETLDYLKEIKEIVEFLGENPYVLIFLHKADPDIIDDPDLQIHVASLGEDIAHIFQDSDLYYEYLQTSIFNFYKTEPTFANVFKRYFSKEEESTSSEEYFELVLNSIVDLKKSFTMVSESISKVLKGMNDRLSAVDNRLKGIELRGGISEQHNQKAKQISKQEHKKIRTPKVSPVALSMSKLANVYPPPPGESTSLTSLMPPPPPPPPSKNKSEKPRKTAEKGSKGPMLRKKLMSELKSVLSFRNIT